MGERSTGPGGDLQGPICGPFHEDPTWAKLMEQSQTDKKEPEQFMSQKTAVAARSEATGSITFEPSPLPAQPTPQISPSPVVAIPSSPLVRAAAEYDEAQRNHKLAQAGLEKAIAEEAATRAEEEHCHKALLDAVAQIAK